jgi:hypothetical protein
MPVVMSLTTAGRLQVLIRLFLEGRLAARGAEVIGLPLVLSLGCGLFWVHFHLTNWIDRHLTHLPISVYVLIVSRQSLTCQRYPACLHTRRLAGAE